MSKIKLEIKNRWTGSVLFRHEKENNTLKDTVEQAIKEGADLGGADLEGANLGGANLEGANLEGANLGGAHLRGAYIYLDADEINSAEIVKNFEEKNNIKITETYINKNVIPTRWNASWKHGLTICDWEVIEKKESAEENKEIEEYKTKYTERYIDIEIINKINELVRVVNKLIKESEEK
jgi:hypothetical protein